MAADAGGDGDAVAGGVFAQVAEGAQADAGRRGGGRLRLAGEQAGGQGGGVADGGAVGAEQGADDLGGQVQVLAHPGGEQVAGEVELAVAAAAAGALGQLAGASVPEVAALLAAGAERDLQRGGQGGQVRRVQAGQRGMVQQVAAARPGRAGCGSGSGSGSGAGRGTGRTV